MTWDKDTMVVVVDDNYFMRQMLVEMLQRTGADPEKIRCFAETAELVSYLEEHACADAVVICDVAMQEGGGADLYKCADDRAHELKFVLIGGPHSAPAGKPLAERERLGFLEKPFTPDDLVAAVRKAAA